MKFHTDGTSPTNGEIFVFGSNQFGIHGRGAAKKAFDDFGAIQGKGKGLAGQSYALPTVYHPKVRSYTLEEIKREVEDFKKVVLSNPDKIFWMTRVGCVLAGYSDKDIAPMFKDFPENVDFPETWKEFLE